MERDSWGRPNIRAWCGIGLYFKLGNVIFQNIGTCRLRSLIGFRAGLRAGQGITSVVLLKKVSCGSCRMITGVIVLEIVVQMKYTGDVLL
jgi:hypothetical protein